MLKGEVIPQQVDVEVDGQRIPLVKEDATHFVHRFRNVQQAIDFSFPRRGSALRCTPCSTVPNPMLQDFSLTLTTRLSGAWRTRS
jgi:hypothetical protein